MKLEALLKRVFFGKPVKGERVNYETFRCHTTIPGLVERPSEKEWKKEFKVSSQYSRFNPTGVWYGDETPEEYNNMLKAVLTGSYK
jgi:hypothetical protein